MGHTVVEAAAGIACAVKPQIAFYERFGADGLRALEDVLANARERGLLVIADVKRGDIGTSFAAYAEAWLDPNSTLESDAMTVHPYHGVGSLTAGFDIAEQHGKGLFVLAATSNPEAGVLQRSRTEAGHTVASDVVEAVSLMNRERAPEAPIGSFGVVIGATLSLQHFGINTQDRPKPVIPVLAPGFGHQGARVEEFARIFGSLAEGVIANESRSLLEGGPNELAERISSRADIISAATQHLSQGAGGDD